MPLSEEAQAKMRVMQEAYLKALPDKIRDIKADLNAWATSSSEEDKNALKTSVHKLAGSAGMYGLDALSAELKSVDMLLAKGDDAELVSQKLEGVEALLK